MNLQKILLASCAVFGFGQSAHAELNLWQQNFVGCSVSSSPYTTQVLFKEANKVRPLMQVSGLNAWAVPKAGGGQEIALTTPDGLTIYGRIVGPQGEDISGALLATTATVIPEASPFDPPQQQAANPQVSAAPSQPIPATPSAQPAQQPVAQQAAPVPPAAPVPAPQAQAQANEPAPVSQTPAPASPPVPAAQGQSPAPTPPKQVASIGSETVPNVPKAGSVDELMQQAQDFAMWFTVNKPKPGSPLVYAFVDPTCPHCAWSFEQLKNRIDDNSIDLRVIMAPILSPESAQIAASIMHQQDIGSALRGQLASVIGTGTPAPKLDPKSFDQNVVAAMQRNVDWMRLNGVPGTPFYLYKTKDGTQFAFGGLKDTQLTGILPAPSPETTASTAGAPAK